MFVVNGGVYGVAAPVFGMVCDRYSPKSIAFLGAVLMVVSFSFMGPLPFLGIETYSKVLEKSCKRAPL